MTEIGVDSLAHPLEFPPEFKQWLTDYVATQVPKLPISQVFGYQLQRVRTATSDAEVSTSSTSYADLGGPTLSNVANGFYLFLLGADCGNTGATSANTVFMSLAINGAAASDDDACVMDPLYQVSSPKTSGLRVVMKQLNAAGGNNTVATRYRTEAGTAYFQWRFLHAIKVLTLDE